MNSKAHMGGIIKATVGTLIMRQKITMRCNARIEIQTS